MVVQSCLLEIWPSSFPPISAGIKQCHHFRSECDHPVVVVFLTKTATVDEEERCLLRGVWWSPSPVEKPPSVTPAGLSLERRCYLYDKIREYCREDVRDIVCPNPDSAAHEQPDTESSAFPLDTLQLLTQCFDDRELFKW